MATGGGPMKGTDGNVGYRSTELDQDPLVESVARGLLQSCDAELTQVSNDLREFTSKQDEMLSTITAYNQSMNSNPQLQQLKSVMEGMKNELDRLTMIRQDMSVIHERAEKLKTRAERLRGLRIQRDRREEELVAKLDDGGGGGGGAGGEGASGDLEEKK